MFAEALSRANSLSAALCASEKHTEAHQRVLSFASGRAFSSRALRDNVAGRFFATLDTEYTQTNRARLSSNTHAGLNWNVNIGALRSRRGGD